MEYVQEFTDNALELLGYLHDILTDLNNSNLTKISPQATQLAINLLKFGTSGSSSDDTKLKLLNGFINQYSNWENVKNRQLQFILNNSKSMFDGIPVDVAAIQFPITYYLELKQKGNFNGNKNEEDWPVTSEDIDTLWKFFDVMVGKSCRYILKKRITEPNFKKEIDVEKYIILFGFNMNK